MSSVIIYCIFSLHDVAYLEVIFSYMIMRVTSAVAVQYARMPIISLWPLTLMLSCMWPILICSLLLLSSVIFTLGCEQKKISGLELDNSGCGYCASHLRYIVFSQTFMQMIIAYNKRISLRKKRNNDLQNELK